MVLETTRLVIRPVGLNDLEAYTELYSDKQTWEFDPFFEPAKLDSQQMLANAVEAQKGLPDTAVEGEFAIATLGNDKLIGLIYASYLDEESTMMELGIALNSSYWRQNFAFEALTTFVNHVFEQGTVHRIAASTDSRNNRCAHLLSRVGFLKEGELRQSFKLADGVYGNICMFGMLRP